MGGPMSDSIDYFFTVISPWTWLGHRQLMEIAARHGKRVNFRPVALAGVWEFSGAAPLAKRTPTRQRYRLVELQRYAQLRGVELNLQPKHFPVNPQLADRAIVALVQGGQDPAEFAFAAGETVWSREGDISDADMLAGLLSDLGFDAAATLEAAQGEASAQGLADNTQAAIAADAMGAPTYVYRGEPFWGQDRLDMLERMIASGREAYPAG